jgi:hypothetical protein
VESGVESGKWKSGKWKVDSGECLVESGKC